MVSLSQEIKKNKFRIPIEEKWFKLQRNWSSGDQKQSKILKPGVVELSTLTLKKENFGVLEWFWAPRNLKSSFQAQVRARGSLPWPKNETSNFISLNITSSSAILESINIKMKRSFQWYIVCKNLTIESKDSGHPERWKSRSRDGSKRGQALPRPDLKISH